VLLKQATLDGIKAGTITVVFRRWPRLRVRTGSTVRTAIGVVAVTAVAPTTVRAVTERHARRAGYASRAALLADLDRYGDGDLYRIDVRPAGPDPRIALRRATRLTPADLATIERKLARMDDANAWTRAVLGVIGERPGVRAGDLAATLGVETLPFKVRVRRLKELGLTESLEVGYRLSPRGRAVIRRLGRATGRSAGRA
jgi:hypothetical protein